MTWYRQHDAPGPGTRYLLHFDAGTKLTLDLACGCLTPEDVSDDGLPEILEPSATCPDCDRGILHTSRTYEGLYALMCRGSLSPAEHGAVLVVGRLASWGLRWSHAESEITRARAKAHARARSAS